jgi:fructose-specific phosphotransferase system IIC component
MEMITGYMAGALAIIGLWSVRVPHEDVRTVFLLAIFWPLTIVAILFMIVVTATGWQFDVDTQAGKMYNFRKPTNPNAKGWALCLLGVEFQLYKTAK